MIIENRIKRLQKEIKYEERKMEVCGYGSSDIKYLYGLKKELEELIAIQELKEDKEYCFYCDISKKRILKEIADVNYFDEWGCAFISLGKEIGVEYNLCVDDGKNCSAIYKVDYNKKDDCIETDYNKFIHYEIDFNNPKWKKELENAMCEALIKFFEI